MPSSYRGPSSVRRTFKAFVITSYRVDCQEICMMRPFLLHCRTSHQIDIKTSVFKVKVSYTSFGQGSNYKTTIWRPTRVLILRPLGHHTLFLKWRTDCRRTVRLLFVYLHSCPQDSTVQYHSNGGTKGLHRFSLKTFKFVNAPDPFVYIHCKVTYAFSNQDLIILRRLNFKISFSYCASIIYLFICCLLLCLWEHDFQRREKRWKNHMLCPA